MANLYNSTFCSSNSKTLLQPSYFVMLLSLRPSVVVFSIQHSVRCIFGLCNVHLASPHVHEDPYLASQTAWDNEQAWSCLGKLTLAHYKQNCAICVDCVLESKQIIRHIHWDDFQCEKMINRFLLCSTFRCDRPPFSLWDASSPPLPIPPAQAFTSERTGRY